MENPTFHLEGVIRSKEEMQDFEGPLTLILLLLSKNKIEIRDIKISEILDQYLAWMAQMQKMDLEIASEFVQMASHLVYIKTRTLLAGTQEEVSELELLLSSLEQLKNRDTFTALKEVVPEMGERLQSGALLLSTPPEPIPKYGEYDYHHRPWELMNALANMMTKGVAVPEEQAVVRIPRPIAYSVRDKGRQIINILQHGSRVTLRSLYDMAQSRSELVATFLSLLEMMSYGSARLEAEEDGYVVEFSGADTDADAILESMDYG